MSKTSKTATASHGVGLHWAMVPSLFAVAPLVSIYATNADQLQPTQMFAPIMLAAIVVLAPTLLAFLVFPRHRFAVLTVCSVLAAVFFYYGHAYGLLDNLRVELGPLVIGPNKLIAAVVVAALVGIFRLGRRRTDQIAQTARAIAVVGVALTIASGGSAVYATVQSGDPSRPVTGSGEIETTQPKGTVELGELPDIYFIVLDAYASNQTLLGVTGYDNTHFTTGLEQRGFYVAPEATSNYAMTFLSLAATLNMDYVNVVAEATPGTDRGPLNEMIRYSEVVTSLQACGYEYVHLASGWGATDDAPLADVIHTGTWSELNQVILETTALRAFGLSAKQSVKDKYSDIVSAFSYLESLPESGGPKFVFAHLLVPHAPYVFTADGERAEDVEASMEAWDTSSVPAYLEQLEATNSMTMRFVDRVLSTSQRPTVVVLQGDHGILFLDDNDSDAEVSRFRQRHSILNAMYFPDGIPEQVHSSVSPVNTFRIIFDEFLGTSLGLLEDRAYHSYYDDPYELTDVTDAVSSDRAPGN